MSKQYTVARLKRIDNTSTIQTYPDLDDHCSHENSDRLECVGNHVDEGSAHRDVVTGPLVSPVKVAVTSAPVKHHRDPAQFWPGNI